MASRWGVQDIALFLVLTILANGLLFGAASPKALVETFYLALYVQIGFSLYLGVFGRWRTTSWLALIGGWAVAEIAGFAAFIIPAGEVGFWLASLSLVGPLLFMLGDATHAAPAAWPIAALLLLGLDIRAMHVARWRRAPLKHVAIFFGGGTGCGGRLGSLGRQSVGRPPDYAAAIPHAAKLAAIAVLRPITGNADQARRNCSCFRCFACARDLALGRRRGTASGPCGLGLELVVAGARCRLGSAWLFGRAAAD